MASHGVQYTHDNTERGIVSENAMPQPAQRAVLKNDIPMIRAFKDARTARIKSIGDAGDKCWSVGHGNESGLGQNANPFKSDWI